ncbi:MAG: hypothetical protein JRF30_07560 [Deltaproteobacteria bacterium]|nr:hypothetical protein [Deltaproteobacteria bacterium]MBW1795493.1 hypothetical protein [Deltaproteobacteria bacterium]MBW2330770.1 hypothetical protein [Deltaproteobacteria bacterium]
MKLDKNPLFRKVASPWYDSDPFCLVISILAAHIFYFSTVGISVALEHHQYERYCWVPMTLTFLSGILLVTNLFRILSRMVNRFTEEE